MAQHIIRHSAPMKFLGLSKEQLLKSRHILSHERIVAWQHANENFKNFHEEIRHRLANFLKEQHHSGLLGKERGYREDRIRLIMSLIKASYNWQKSISYETHAMLEFAKSIGDNILNIENGIQLKQQYQALLTQRMVGFFCIEIVLTYALHKEYRKIFDNFAPNSEQITLFTINKHDKEAELKVSIGEEIFNLRLTDLDFNELFSKIINFFRKKHCLTNESKIYLEALAGKDRL